MGDVTTNGPNLYAQLAYRMRASLGEFDDPNRDLEGLVKELAAFKRAHLTQPAQAVDVEPDPALLASMATCLHHGFGLLDARQQQSMLHDMRKLWDEVMGRGYYRPENRERYTAHIHAAALPNANGKEG